MSTQSVIIFTRMRWLEMDVMVLWNSRKGPAQPIGEVVSERSITGILEEDVMTFSILFGLEGLYL